MKGPRINGEQYSISVLRVLSRDAFGRPTSAEFVYDEQVVDLTDGKPNDFVTALIKSHLLEMKMGGNA